MRKPDYCPEWFNIDLYDNLAHQTRDALSFALWTRKMNYKSYLLEIEGEDIRNGGNNITKEDVKKYALEWLAMLATQSMIIPAQYIGSNQDKENYNPLKVEPNIIKEVKLKDIAYLYAQSYFELPYMREFFQKASMHFDEAIRRGYIDQALENAEYIIEDKFPTLQSEYGAALSDKLNYADMFIIDLSQSDEVLKMAFEQKLQEIREKEAAHEQKHPFWYSGRTKRFSDSEIKRIVEYRVFAYIDLYTYGQITGRKFTDIEMAAMIYPPRENTPLDFDAVDRISRTVKPKAIELLERTNPSLLL